MKNEALEVLKTRRSVRAYRPEQISDEALYAVLDAGTWAPTGRNRQTPVIVAVQNKEERDEVSRLNAKIMGTDRDPYYGAPTIVVVLAENDDFAQLNGAAVTTNMLNAAHAVGLGSCWIHRPRQMFETPEGKALLRLWGLSEDLVGVASIALGCAAGDEPKPAPRKENYYIVRK